ncbi:MAG: DNA alkylation repair protein [Fermentimonas sp.]|nr:DNA alkylation repair protein [Fermentimonas sp.]
MKDILRQIRTDLRLSMNGAVSSSLRNKGVNYKMIFGVETPRIKVISQKYQPDKLLAEALWNEDVREMKIMATLLYPKEQFAEETALSWISEINDQELREQVCKNILQKLPYADKLVEKNISRENDSIVTTGLWLFARLCMTGSDLVNKIDTEMLLNIATRKLKSESMLLRQSALNALKYYGRLSRDRSELILNKTEFLKCSQDIVDNEMYDQLKFEFGYED